MLFKTQSVLSEYSYQLNHAEVVRARARIFNELMSQESGEHVNTEIAAQLQYLNRRVPRSEQAKRFSHHADSSLLRRVAAKHFWDKDLSVVAWGSLHSIQNHAHYHRPYRRSTLGWYGTSPSDVY